MPLGESRRLLERRTVKQVEALNVAYSFLRHFTEMQSRELLDSVRDELRVARALAQR